MGDLAVYVGQPMQDAMEKLARFCYEADQELIQKLMEHWKPLTSWMASTPTVQNAKDWSSQRLVWIASRSPMTLG